MTKPTGGPRGRQRKNPFPEDISSETTKASAKATATVEDDEALIESASWN